MPDRASRWVSLLVRVDVEILDPDWTAKDLIENTPDYFTSMIADAEARERDAYTYGDDQPPWSPSRPYRIDTADLTVFTEGDYVDDLFDIRNAPDGIRTQLVKIAGLPPAERRRVSFLDVDTGLGILARKADGIDCTADESAWIKGVFDRVDPFDPDTIAGRLAAAFPLEWAEWNTEVENGDREDTLLVSILERWESQPPTPQRRLAALVDEYGDSGVPCYTDRPVWNPDTPFLMVEKNRKSEPPYWLTMHRTADDAVDAHVNQEYAEDWELETLVDLRTGDTYDLEVRARAVPTGSAG